MGRRCTNLHVKINNGWTRSLQKSIHEKPLDPIKLETQHSRCEERESGKPQLFLPSISDFIKLCIWFILNGVHLRRNEIIHCFYVLFFRCEGHIRCSCYSMISLGFLFLMASTAVLAPPVGHFEQWANCVFREGTGNAIWQQIIARGAVYVFNHHASPTRNWNY